MSRRNLCIIWIIFLTSLSVVLAKLAFGGLVIGCPKHEIITFSSEEIKCPIDNLPLSEVKEGYLAEGRRVILDALYEEEKKQLGIKHDAKLIVIIYKSPYTGEASFTPGQDRLGNKLERKYVQMKYDCRKMLSSEKIKDYCQPLGHAPEELEEQAQRRAEIVIPKIKQSMERSITDSWPIFYKQYKASGISDEDIKRYWEIYKEKIYEEYNYDPKSGEFKSIKLEEGLEYYRDPKTGKFKQKTAD